MTDLLLKQDRIGSGIHKSEIATSNFTTPTSDRSEIASALNRSDNLVLLLSYDGSDTRIVEANPTACKVIQYTNDEIVGQSFSALIAPDCDPKSIKGFHAAVEVGLDHRCELLCLTRRGEKFWLGLHLMPTVIRTHTQYLLLGHDITDKIRRQEQDQAIQGLLAKAFSIVEVPMYFADLNGRFVLANPAFEGLIGAQPGSLIATAVNDCYATRFHDKLNAARSEQNISGDTYSIELSLVRQDGAEIPGQATVTIIQRPSLTRFRITTFNTCVAAPLTSEATNLQTAAGQIQLIGLEAVRVSLGSGWEAVKDKAMSTAKGVIQASLRPGDTFCVDPDKGFVVFFTDTSEHEAAIHSAAIGQEIRRALIGQGATPEIAHVLSAATMLPPNTMTESAASRADIVRARIADLAHASRENTRDALLQALQSPKCEIDAVYSSGHKMPIGWFLRLSTTTKNAVDAAVALLPPAETAMLDQNRTIIGFAHDHLTRSVLKSSSALVFIVLSSDVLFVRKRMEAAVAALRLVSEALRKQLVIIVDLPPGYASYKLREELPQLKLLCRGLGIAVRDVESTEVDISGLGLSLMFVENVDASARVRLNTRARKLRVQQCKVMVRCALHDDIVTLLEEGAGFVSISQRVVD